ncbi:MAG: Rpp14/Pop5 family protein [Candidatus Bathyarchaeia archaeon]
MPIRVKRRYIAVKIDSEATPSSKDFMKALWDSLIKLFGEYGASKTGATLIEYQDEEKTAIIRVFHKEVETVRAALATITKINDKPATAHVIKVSGTLRALKNKLKATKKRST